MIFLKDTNILKVYKRPFFLPTRETDPVADKKNGSIIFLLTPNRQSSINLINYPLAVNKLRYRSYYFEKDLTFFLHSNGVESDDEDLEESYVRDVNKKEIINEEFTASDLSDDFFISGDDASVDLFWKEVVPKLTPILYKAKELYNITTFPDLYITLSSVFDINKDFYFNMKKTDGGKAEIHITLPSFRNYESLDSYVNRIANYIIKCLVISKDNDLAMTIIPKIIADHMIDADSREAEYGKFLEDKYKDFHKDLEDHNYKNIISILSRNFGLHPEEAYFEDEVSEAADPISLDNLGRRFKYLSTTKIKRQNSKAINGIRRQMDRIVFTPMINIPKVGSPNMESYYSIKGLEEDQDYIRLNENTVMLLENQATDNYLKRFLYKDRIRRRKVILDIDKQIKTEVAPITYAFPTIAQYKRKNLFVDLYYFNQSFFKNCNLNPRRTLDIYTELIDNLINDTRYNAYGYTKRTIFIPVLDWVNNPSTRMWMYTESMNPVSVLYQLMYHNPSKAKSVFKNIDLVFFDTDRYFRLNFGNMTPRVIKQSATKFKNFISNFCRHADFDAEDVDNSMTDSHEAIKADIYDKIEAKKGIDLTGKENVTPVQTQEKSKPNPVVTPVAPTPTPSVVNKPITPTRTVSNKIPDSSKFNKIPKSDDIQNPVVQKQIATTAKKEVEKKVDDATISKKADKDKEVRKEEEKQQLAKMVDKAASTSSNTDEALDKLDIDRKKAIDMMNDIQSVSSGNVDISATRAARFNNLANDLLDKKINNKSIKDMLNENPSEEKVPETKLNLATTNPEWKELTYVNFDKNYDLDKDIVANFAHFAECSYPLAIVKIDAENTSTSEDRIETYTVQYENDIGKRFTVKVDIPVMKDNRFLLRGNAKVIATQFLNMPILKTDLDAAQIITNYQKIFIYRSTSKLGSSSSLMSRIIKTLKKYKGDSLVITYGDNTRVCNKYQVPIDYIDISSMFNTIENKKTGIKWYFNQTEIRDDFGNQVNESKGVPIAYDSKKHELLYMDNMNTPFAQILFNDLFTDDVFRKKIKSIPSSKGGAFSQCSILDEKMPLVLVASFRCGLSNLLKRAKVRYEWKDEITKEEKYAFDKDYIIFKDGYLLFDASNYANTLLLNGLKELPTAMCTMGDMDVRDTYVDFLQDYGGRIKADGIENFYDCLVDPITKEVLEHYNLPTDFVDILLYANVLMADNKYVRHTDTASRRIRREEMVAAYTYEALTESYAVYANARRRGSAQAEFTIKQTIVIDKLLQSPISQDDSVNNALGAVEETNNVTFKGKSGLNSDRAYSLDKRTYDDSMVNVLGQSTNFSASVGINRAATIDMNIKGVRGYIKQNNGDTDKMNTAKTLTATEALVPFEVTSDDSGRIGMTYLQTSKHMVRTEKSDPPLVTNGADQALPYLTTDTFAFKAKYDGVVREINDKYIVVEYVNGKKDYVNLQETIKKNSDGGYYVPMKLTSGEQLKVGSKFKQNDILAYDALSFSNDIGESDNLAYNIGKLAKVAIISTDDGYEDSGICTKKLAEDLTTKVIYEFEHVIEKDSLIVDYRKVGDIINVGDPLLIWQDAFGDEADVNQIMKVLSRTGIDASTLGRRTVESKTTGKIVGIKVFRTCDLDGMSESVRAFVDEYERPINELKAKLEAQGVDTRSLPATYKLKPTGKLKKAQDAIYVEYYIEHDDKVGVGDKGTYLSANKFTVKSIIPEGKEPYTDFRPDEEISAFLSVSSINHRMVTSIIKNGIMNKLMIELDRSVKDMLGIPYDVSKL